MARAPSLLLPVLLALAACDRGPAPATPADPSQAATSRPAGDGVSPETAEICIREGDHLVVIVDVATRDAQGRAVVSASLEAGTPAQTAAASRSAFRMRPETRAFEASLADALTAEMRVPSTTTSLKLIGTSAGGASWSKTITIPRDFLPK